MYIYQQIISIHKKWQSSNIPLPYIYMLKINVFIFLYLVCGDVDVKSTK